MKLPLIASLTLAFLSPVNASVDPEVHKMCLEAKDYQGCIKAHKKTSNSNKVVKRKGYRKALSECLKETSKWDSLTGKPKQSIRKACEVVANIDSEKIFKDRFVTVPWLETDDKKGVLRDFFNWLLVGSMTHKSSIERNLNADYLVQHSLCTTEKFAEIAEVKTLEYKDINAAFEHCDHFIRLSRLVAGNRVFLKENDDFSWDYAIKEDSVKQAKIRGSYGRYIAFNARSRNRYTGTSGYVIPGKRGYIDCNWGGSGGFYGDSNSIGGGYSEGGGCYGKGSTDPIYVPGEKGGVQSQVFKYLLDCQDKTYDRKGDVIDAAGGAKKGWMSIPSGDPNTLFIQRAYCPVISILPKQ